VTNLTEVDRDVWGRIEARAADNARRGLRICPADRRRFTEGDCHVLARAIWKLTGWPIATYHHPRRGADGHAFVLVGDRHLLDVLGLQTIAEARAIWGLFAKGMDIRETTWRELRNAWGGSSAYSMQRARIVAQRLVASVPLSTAIPNPEGT
jgi:hypothetical protein